MENSKSNQNKEDFDEINEEQKNNKALITFVQFNKYYLILFISPIFLMLFQYFLLKIDEYNIIINSYFYSLILTEFVYILAGLFYFISYFRKNSNINANNKFLIGTKYLNNKSNNYNSKKVYLFYFLLSALLIIDIFANTYTSKYTKFNENSYLILLIPLFSKFILKENLYKHQYLSLMISIIAWIILNIPICLKVKKEDILANFINLIHALIYSIFLVLIKYVNNKFFISPLQSSLIFGIISIILSLIGFIIYSLIKYGDLQIFNNLFDFSKVDNKLTLSIYIILFFIFSTTCDLLILLIIFYFSPIFLCVTEILGPFLLWIENAIEYNNDTKLELAVNPIGYIIGIFSSLIYNEIIIFNFCGLSKNTKKFVNQRMDEEILEMEDINKINNDDILGINTIDSNYEIVLSNN